MATTYLTRAASGSVTSSTTFTFSFWLKRGTLGSLQFPFIHENASSHAQKLGLNFESTDKLRMSWYNGSSEYNLDTKMVFRDTSAWYHIVFRYDTTQSTDTDRVRIYVNGELQAITNIGGGSPTYPAEDATMNLGQKILCVGRYQASSPNYYFDGSLSHFYYCDGQSYGADTFGSTDATTGEWKINTSPTVTYGTNGFLILKDGNSVTNQAGNSSGNFSVSGGTLTNTEDCPSDVFCTLNPLIPTGDLTFSAGNTKMVSGSSGLTGGGIGTIGVNKGKFYWEVKIASLVQNHCNGVISELTTELNDNVAGLSHDVGATVFRNDDGGEMVKDGTETTADYGLFTAGQIMGIALNADDYEISIYRNGSAIVTDYALSTTRGTLFPYLGSGISTTWEANFGNGYFGTTQISSEGINASNIGKFEYDVPTGYTALSLKGINS